MKCVRPSVRVAIQLSVCLRVIDVKMVMKVRGEFRRGQPAMRVIVGMRVGHIRIDLVRSGRWHPSLPFDRDAHLHCAHDARRFEGGREFRLGRISEPAIAFGKAGAQHGRLEELEPPPVGNGSPHDLIEKRLRGPSAHVVRQILHRSSPSYSITLLGTSREMVGAEAGGCPQGCGVHTYAMDLPALLN
jgi:hypothetical protein